MENDNQPIIDSTNNGDIITPESTPFGEANNVANNNKKKPVLLIVVGILVAAAIGVGLYFIIRTPAAPESKQNDTSSTSDKSEDKKEKAKYTTEKNEQTGEREQFGNDDTKDNSGEAFVEYQTDIEESASSTNEEVFDAKLSKVVYYIAVEEYDNAREALGSIDQSTLSEEQLERYNNVSADLQTAESGGNVD